MLFRNPLLMILFASMSLISVNAARAVEPAPGDEFEMSEVMRIPFSVVGTATGPDAEVVNVAFAQALKKAGDEAAVYQAATGLQAVVVVDWLRTFSQSGVTNGVFSATIRLEGVIVITANPAPPIPPLPLGIPYIAPVLYVY